MISIDSDLCQVCGLCTRVCPRRILEIIDPEGNKQTVVIDVREELCLECGHCMSVCRTGAITIDTLEIDSFKPVRKLEISSQDLLQLMEQRRSVRRYRKKTVPRQVIEQVVEAAEKAPTGTGKRTTSVLIIDDTKKIDEISQMAYDLYGGLEKAIKNPVAKFFVKKKVGGDMMSVLEQFVMPAFHWYSKWWEEGSGNELLRDAPVVVMFHSPNREPEGAVNCAIAAFHSILMAETIGIGTCFNSLIAEAANHSKEMKHLLQLPDDRSVHAAFTMGYPKYKYRKVIPRKLAEVRYM